MASVTFLGAARTVTGSKYLVELGDDRLLVDCGLFQGLKELRLRNWEPLPVDAASIHAVVLTHAHVDHSGFLPRLFAQGFRGRVFCTPGTADLCRIVLPDAGRLAEEDAREANRQGYSRHKPALPLFTETDAFRALSNLQPVGFDRPVPVMPGVEVTFVGSGHLLGSAFALMAIGGAAGRRAASCSAATSGATAVPSFRTRSRWPRPTCWWSSRRTAIASTNRTTRPSGWPSSCARRSRRAGSSSSRRSRWDGWKKSSTG